MYLWIVSVITYTLPFLLHCVGIYLLCTRCANIGENQKYLIINLCLSEIFVTISGSVRTLMLSLYGKTNFTYHLSGIANIAASFPYYMTMYLLTLDRFAEIYLNIKYPLYWSEKHSRYAMAIIWSVASILLIYLFVNILLYPRTGFLRIEKICFLYVFSIADFVFMVIALFTYSFIGKRLRRNRRTVSVGVVKLTKDIMKIDQSLDKKKCFNKGINRHLKLPTLLIVSFFIFIEIPDLVIFCMYHANATMTKTVMMSCRILYGIGFTFDAFLYVLLSTRLRKWVTDDLV